MRVSFMYFVASVKIEADIKVYLVPKRVVSRSYVWRVK